MKICFAVLSLLYYYHNVNIWFVSANCGGNSVDVEPWIKKGHALEDSVFWKGTMSDIAACAKGCIRRKVCQSFNYDMLTSKCELNLAKEGEKPFRTGSQGLIYSDISKWLESQFDPSCASRPCSDHEVCLPGALANNPAAAPDSCSFFCLASTLVCPKPYPGFNGDRFVGSVIDFTCPKGHVGGDSAECLVTQQLSKQINQNCPLLHQHSCTADTECADIEATCIDKKCECSNIQYYDASDFRCKHKFKLEGGSSNLKGVLMVYNNGNWGNVRYEDWIWTASIAMCKDLNSSFIYGGAIYDISSSTQPVSVLSYKLNGLECTSESDCESSFAAYTYQFDEKSDHDKDVGLECYDHNISDDIKLDLSTDDGGDYKLQVKYNGEWGSVCGDQWGGDNADVACRSIYPNQKKDSEKKDAFPNDAGPFHIDSVQCDGGESHLFYCRNGGWNKSLACGVKVVALSCKDI